MIKKETRIINVQYCDFCNKEIKTTPHILWGKDKKTKFHFHKEKKEDEKFNCLVKYKMKQMREDAIEEKLSDGKFHNLQIVQKNNVKQTFIDNKEF